GDAAHAITPGMGQGAGMAMEGAAVLAEELAAADRHEKTLDAALADYARRRPPRVDTIARLSRAVIGRGPLTHPVACWLRSLRIRREGRRVHEVEATLERLLRWPPGAGRDEEEGCTGSSTSRSRPRTRSPPRSSSSVRSAWRSSGVAPAGSRA